MPLAELPYGVCRVLVLIPPLAAPTAEKRRPFGRALMSAPVSDHDVVALRRFTPGMVITRRGTLRTGEAARQSPPVRRRNHLLEIHLARICVRRKAWCGRNRPCSASRKSRECSRAAGRAPSRRATAGRSWPCNSSSSIDRPDIPITSVITLATFRPRPPARDAGDRPLAPVFNLPLAIPRQIAQSQIGACGTRLPRNNPHSATARPLAVPHVRLAARQLLQCCMFTNSSVPSSKR